MEPVTMSSSSPSSSYCSIEDVQNRLKRLLEENANLRSTLQQNNLYLNQLKETMLKWQAEVTKLQDENRTKSTEAKTLVSKLRRQNEQLFKLLDENRISYTHVDTLKEELQPELSLSSESADLGSFIVISEQPPSVKDVVADPPSYSLKRVVNDEDPLCNQLQKENETLRAKLHEEFERSEKNRKLLNETQDQLNRLTVSHEELVKQWAQVSSIQSSLKANSPDYAELYRQADELCASLTARVGSAEELLITKEKEITDLLSKLRSMQADLENASVFKTQAEVYSADFEAERRAREQLAAEKDELEQQLRLLRRQLGPSGTAKQPERQLECPLCNMIFSSEAGITNHVEACLNNNSSGMFP